MSLIETLIMATRKGLHVQQSVTVYPVGTKCTISGDIPAHVSAIRLNGVGVDYLIAWWDGNNRHNEFLDTFEVKFESEPTLEIGFHANGATNAN